MISLLYILTYLFLLLFYLFIMFCNYSMKCLWHIYFYQFQSFSIKKQGEGQKYNLAKLFSLSLSQLSLFVEFLKKKFSVLGPRRQGWLGLKEA